MNHDLLRYRQVMMIIGLLVGTLLLAFSCPVVIRSVAAPLRFFQLWPPLMPDGGWDTHQVLAALGLALFLLGVLLLAYKTNRA